MRRNALFVTLVFFAVLPALASATPSEDIYDRLFGTESKAAERAKPKDKLEFARKLLLAAGETKDDKPLQALLYGKAFDFAITSPEGYPVAADAMSLLVKAQPNLATTADERLLTLDELKFRTARADQKPVIAGELADVAARVAAAKARHGDLDGAQAVLRRAAPAVKSAGKEQSAAFDARTKQLSGRITASKRIAQLTAKAADSANRTELATLLLIEVDKPTDALKAAKEANDDGLARIATLASKKPIELKPAELKDLGDWYYAKSKTASDWGKRRALEHAETLYGAMLQREGLSDIDRLGAKLPHAEALKPCAHSGDPKCGFLSPQLIAPAHEITITRRCLHS